MVAKSITTLLGIDASMLEALVQNKAALAVLCRDPKMQEVQQNVTVVALERNPAIIDTSNNALTRVTQRNTS